MAKTQISTFPQTVSLQEASSLLGVTKATLRNWDKAGKLSATRHPINGYRLYRSDELLSLQSQLGLFPAEASEPEVLDLRGAKRLVGRLQTILRDTDSQSNIVGRFDEITKLMFAKVVSDRNLFSDHDSPFASLASSGTAPAVQSYYHALALRFRKIVPSRFAQIACSPRAIEECVAVLKQLNFAETRFDLKGVAYEEVVKNTFDKGDHQQFFTPPQIVEFVISACEPHIHGDVCDPASGTGGFLAHIARRGCDYRSLTGIEIDERLAWVTGINAMLHDGHDIHAVHLPNGGTLGPEAAGYYSRFDFIATNPPFGSDFADRAMLETMRLGEGRPARRRGILFVEQCHRLLRDEGVLAIVLDEGVLNLSHADDVRTFITRNFDLKAVISLPESAFMPYATVNSSVLILRKRASPGNNQSVFYAKADAVGRKANGDDDVKYDKEGQASSDSDLPEILTAWKRFSSETITGGGENIYVADVAAHFSSEEGEHRLDFQYHHPSRQESKTLIATSRHPLHRLGTLCEERAISIIPAEQLPDTLIRYTGLANIEAKTGHACQVPTPANSLKSSVKEYLPGDILFAKMRPGLRKVAVMHMEEPGYCSSECLVLKVRDRQDGEPLIDPELLGIMLRSDFVFGQIVHLIAGIGRPRISGREVLNVLLPVPSSSDQSGIKGKYHQSRVRSRSLMELASKLQGEAAEIEVSSYHSVVTDFLGIS